MEYEICGDMDPANQTIIGLDIGGTKTVVVEGSARAEILRREEIATVASKPFDDTFPRIAAPPPFRRDLHA
jgi:predicted NBD/HSP70 family sugar kinase